MDKRRQICIKSCEKGPVTTGLIGTSRGSGVTHLTVLMANYIVGVRHETCAVLEWNDHGDFERLERIVKGKVSQSPCFTVFHADYYKAAGARELLGCAQNGYEQILIDFGCGFRTQKIEFLRCGKKYVIGALTEWQIEGFQEFCHEMKGEAGYKSWRYGAAFGSEMTRRELKKRLSLPIERIPLSVDPFALNRAMMAYFEK